MDTADLIEALAGIPVQHHDGMAPTGARLPYTVSRPLLLDPLTGAINGDAIDWDLSFTIYCCAASVAASFNLAQAVIATLHGHYMHGSTLAASMGYAGAMVEGQYETQVTIQINQGGIQ